MTEFLVFTIQAPLASWGDVAVGESRGSWDRPGRSAILGIVGAALGIERSDRDGQSALRDGYRMAVRANNTGTVMQDYHTMQSLPQNIIKKYGVRTRARMWTVDKTERETVLSRRAYRQNSLYCVALWSTAVARWGLADIARALRQPVYALYAGRRSNPLGLPVRPELVTAESLADVFQGYEPFPGSLKSELSRLQPRAGWGNEVAHDVVDDVASGLDPAHQVHAMRRDVPTDRKGWLFEDRHVVIGLLPSLESAHE